MAQKVYEGWAQSRAAKGSLAKLLQLLDQPLPENTKLPPPDPLSLQVGIRFQEFDFAMDQTFQRYFKDSILRFVAGSALDHWKYGWEKHNP